MQMLLINPQDAHLFGELHLTLLKPFITGSPLKSMECTVKQFRWSETLGRDFRGRRVWTHHWVKHTIYRILCATALRRDKNVYNNKHYEYVTLPAINLRNSRRSKYLDDSRVTKSKLTQTQAPIGPVVLMVQIFPFTIHKKPDQSVNFWQDFFCLTTWAFQNKVKQTQQRQRSSVWENLGSGILHFLHSVSECVLEMRSACLSGWLECKDHIQSTDYHTMINVSLLLLINS